MYQIKFYIASSSYFLPVFIFSSISSMFSFLCNGDVCFGKGIATSLSKFHPEIYILVVSWSLIIIKDSANASSFFIAVPVYKITVTLFFKFGIKQNIKSITGVFISLMKMPGIFFKQIIRR